MLVTASRLDDESFDPFDQSAELQLNSETPFSKITAADAASTRLLTLTTTYPPPMSTNVSISHKGKSYVVQIDLTSTVSSFRAQLAELTSIPVENQKLLFKGKRASAKSDDTLEAFGLKDGTKVQMLGSTAEEIGGLRAVEDEKNRTEQILRNREGQARVLQTTFSSLSSRLTAISV